MTWRQLDPSTLSTSAFFTYLTQAVVPRPIALVSTVDAHGQPNLSPYSFFNLFSANPPIMVFSPSRSVRDNSIKHTLDNVQACPEAVIHVVNYPMVQQTSLSSTAYAKGVNEFVKAGFTMLPSVGVRPPRVQEAPIAFECAVQQIIPLGDQGGAGNLVLCEVKLMHVLASLWGEDGIRPDALEAVARLGQDWYCKIEAANLFEVPKPLQTKGIGVDALPEAVRNSAVLTGNNLGLLGNVERLPSEAELAQWAGENPDWQAKLSSSASSSLASLATRHQLATEALQTGSPTALNKAWFFLLYAGKG